MVINTYFNNIKQISEKITKRETKHLSIDADMNHQYQKNPASKANIAKIAAILHLSLAKVFLSETTSFHYFPQGFRKSKKFGHWTLGSGAKIHLSQVNT